jgi:putative ABC transport system substrate-binding protein
VDSRSALRFNFGRLDPMRALDRRRLSMLGRRRMLTTLVLGLGALAAPASGQAPTGHGMARVAVLSGGTANPAFDRLFLGALGEAGWTQGRNLAYEVRAADGRYDRLPALATELLRWQPQVIVTVQTPATQALLKLGTTIPIVMNGHGDPVRYGLVKNLARPEGNVTGVSFLVNEVAVKTVELLKEAAPNTTRVAVVTNPDNPGALPVLEAIREAAPKLAISTYNVEARTLEELDRAIAGLARERADGVFLGPEGLIITHRQRIIDAAASRRIPVVGANAAFSESGALLSYSPHGPSIMRATARYVDRLLRGARPSDLPVEQPARFELIVNQNAARSLGLTVPSTLILRADRIIQTQ